jgi:phosphoglycerate dehydrogenase-like enzyme
MTLAVLVRDDNDADSYVVSDLADGTLSSVGDLRVLHYSDPEDLPPGYEDVEALVVSSGHVEEQLAVAARLPSLRLVQTLSAGVERWEGRLPDGVLLSNARGAHGGATAEWAITALLAVYRELPGFVVAQQAARWDPRTTDTLAGKSVLVLGAGDLAAEFRRRAEPFDASVEVVGRRARPGVHAMEEVPTLLPQADAVVVMLPLTEATRGIVGAEQLGRMADGAVLVNAGRGPLVDTDALLGELRDGRLRAALDVTDPEPLPDGHPLWSAPNLLLTPHVAGSTAGYADRAWQVAAEQIAQFVAGQDPDNLQS